MTVSTGFIRQFGVGCLGQSGWEFRGTCWTYVAELPTTGRYALAASCSEMSAPTTFLIASVRGDRALRALARC